MNETHEPWKRAVGSTAGRCIARIAPAHSGPSGPIPASKTPTAVADRLPRRPGRSLPDRGLFWWGGDRGIEPEPYVVPPHSAPPVTVVDSGLTLLAYQRALARSPEDLDALLAKEAAVAPEPNPELVRISAFPRSDAALRALLGDD